MKTSIYAVLLCFVAVAIGFKYPDMFRPKVEMNEFSGVKTDTRKIFKSLPVNRDKLNILYGDGGKFLKHYLAGSIFKRTVGNFKLKNCGDPKVETFYIESLKVSPDPLVFPGDLSVSFNITVKKLIDAPVKASVVMTGKKQGKIPCLGMIGSCLYNDICSLLGMIQQCPDPFMRRGIPCECPFPQGNYLLPKTTFEVGIPVFGADDYTVVLNMTKNDEPVGCYKLSISVGN